MSPLRISFIIALLVASAEAEEVQITDNAEFIDPNDMGGCESCPEDSDEEDVFSLSL